MEFTCKDCGAKVSDKMLFCPKCGQILEVPKDLAVEGGQQPFGGVPTEKKPSFMSFKRPFIWIILSLLLTLAIAAVALLAIYSGLKKDKVAAPAEQVAMTKKDAAPAEEAEAILAEECVAVAVEAEQIDFFDTTGWAIDQEEFDYGTISTLNYNTYRARTSQMCQYYYSWANAGIDMQTYTTAVSFAKVTRLRSNPWISEYNIKGSINYGDKVVVQEFSSGGDWCYVEVTGMGYTGYVSRDFLMSQSDFNIYRTVELNSFYLNDTLTEAKQRHALVDVVKSLVASQYMSDVKVYDFQKYYIDESTTIGVYKIGHQWANNTLLVAVEFVTGNEGHRFIGAVPGDVVDSIERDYNGGYKIDFKKR